MYEEDEVSPRHQQQSPPQQQQRGPEEDSDQPAGDQQYDEGLVDYTNQQGAGAEEDQSHQPLQQEASSPTHSGNNVAGGGGAGATISPTHSTTSAQQGKAEVKILETADDIQDRREQVLGRYAAFKSETKVKREKLEDSRRFQYFKRDSDELESWIYEKLQAASDETFKDATNLQAKIQKHQVCDGLSFLDPNYLIQVATGYEIMKH